MKTHIYLEVIGKQLLATLKTAEIEILFVDDDVFIDLRPMYSFPICAVLLDTKNNSISLRQHPDFLDEKTVVVEAIKKVKEYRVEIYEPFERLKIAIDELSRHMKDNPEWKSS
jgi:hypothetical protein